MSFGPFDLSPPRDASGARPVAWAAYGKQGFQRAGSLSLTHRTRSFARDDEPTTLCGISIPSARSGTEIASAGRGRCSRCAAA